MARGAALPVEPGWELVGEAFARITADGTPASLVLFQDGRRIVHLAAGADAAGRAFASTSPVFLYSAVKPLAALAALLAVAGGELALDGTVASDWPEFGAHGKGLVTVREALAHGAAIPGWREPLDLARLHDREAAAGALAASEPWWLPGEPGEHAVSYGHLVDGILRRTTGRDIEDWWAELRRATGTAVALTAATAPLPPAPLVDAGGRWRAERLAATGLMGRLLRNPPELVDATAVNGPAGRALVAPAVAGYASARDLAAIWAWWTGPGGAARLGRALRDESLSPQLSGRDHVLDRAVAWGLGPQVDADFWGLAGVGGCVGGHDPRSGVSLGFTTPLLGSLDRLDPLDEALAAIA